MERQISFVIEGVVNTRVIVTELENGDLKFDLEVLGGGNIGDLRALFFDLQGFDASSGSLSVYATSDFEGDVTDQAFEEEGVDTLGRDANIKGSVSNELGDFDVGIEFGTSGIAQDDIQATSFVLTSATGPLSLDMLGFADFGIRYTSVGELDGPRDGSAKIGDTTGGIAASDVLEVKENETATINLLNNDSATGSVIPQSITLQTDAGVFGTLEIAADGTATLVADGAAAEALNDGETAIFEVAYSVESGPDVAMAGVRVTIHGVTDQMLDPLFTNGDDFFDFNHHDASGYDPASFYNALGGNDRVILPISEVEAAAVGFDLSQTFYSGDGNDNVTASSADSSIDTGAGNDTLQDRMGDDTLVAGAGTDRVFVIGGHNVIDGGEGTDTLRYDALSDGGVSLDAAFGTATHALGSDTFTGFEWYVGSRQDDVMAGGDGAELFLDLAGDDWIDGRGGNDSFQVYEGNDVILGGAGRDGFTIMSGEGTKLLDGGDDVDSLQLAHLSDGILLDVSQKELVFGTTQSTVMNFETYYLTRHSDVFVGSDGAETVFGYEGDDVMTGLGGADTFAFDLRLVNGDDTITDFDITEDVLRINSSSLHGDRYLYVSDLDMQQVGGDTLITFNNGDTLALEDILMGDLTASNFHFYL